MSCARTHALVDLVACVRAAWKLSTNSGRRGSAPPAVPVTEKMTCPGVSILNFVIRTGVTEVNLSQYGSIPRWKRPAHRGHLHAPRDLHEVHHITQDIDTLILLLWLEVFHVVHAVRHEPQKLRAGILFILEASITRVVSSVSWNISTCGGVGGSQQTTTVNLAPTLACFDSLALRAPQSTTLRSMSGPVNSSWPCVPSLIWMSTSPSPEWKWKSVFSWRLGSRTRLPRRILKEVCRTFWRLFFSFILAPMSVEMAEEETTFCSGASNCSVLTNRPRRGFHTCPAAVAALGLLLLVLPLLDPACASADAGATPDATAAAADDDDDDDDDADDEAGASTGGAA
jgi:hypothetical protein